MVNEKQKREPVRKAGERAGARWNDPAQLLDPADLELLLRTDPHQLLGRIMELNRGPRYHNHLEAFALMMRLAELRREREQGPPARD